MNRCDMPTWEMLDRLLEAAGVPQPLTFDVYDWAAEIALRDNNQRHAIDGLKQHNDDVARLARLQLTAISRITPEMPRKTMDAEAVRRILRSHADQLGGGRVTFHSLTCQDPCPGWGCQCCHDCPDTPPRTQPTCTAPELLHIGTPVALCGEVGEHEVPHRLCGDCVRTLLNALAPTETPCCATQDATHGTAERLAEDRKHGRICTAENNAPPATGKVNGGRLAAAPTDLTGRSATRHEDTA